MMMMMMMMMMPALLDLYSASSLKQHSTGKHVDPLDSKPTSHALPPKSIMFSEETANNNVIIFGLTDATRSGLDIAGKLLKVA
jgi:hypothetical protein